jgi:hypothetical protein
MLPPYAEKPYAQQDTWDVIISLLRIAIEPFKPLAPIFHLATIVIVVFIALLREKMGRVIAAYIGLNYLVIAFASAVGRTEKYGLVVQTSLLIASSVLGIAWMVVAIRGDLQTSSKSFSWRHYWLLPLALLAFWAPYTPVGAEVQPDFNPLLLLTSEYGLTFCFTTPVFLFLLILFYPHVNDFAYHITGFNGFLYGLVNMVHFYSPGSVWMGALHLPLLIISLYALMLPRMAKPNRGG